MYKLKIEDLVICTFDKTIIAYKLNLLKKNINKNKHKKYPCFTSQHFSFLFPLWTFCSSWKKNVWKSMKPLTVFQDFIMRQFKNKSSLLKVYKDIKNMSPDIIGNIILQSVRTCSKKIIKSCFKYYTHPLYQNRNAHYPLREVILHVFIFLSAILIFRKLHTTNAIVKSIN